MADCIDTRTESRDRQRVLVAQAKAGDHVAFAELLRLCDRSVRAAAWRIVGDATAIDDVLQEAYVKAFRSLERFDPAGPATFGSWLYRIVHRTSIDHRRRIRPLIAAPDERGASSAASVERAAPDDHRRAEQRTALRDGFAALEPHLAATVALVDGEGWTQLEAAAFLGVGNSSIGRYLAAGRRQLREHLEEQGVTP